MATAVDVVVGAVEPVGEALVVMSGVGLGIGVAVFVVKVGWGLIKSFLGEVSTYHGDGCDCDGCTSTRS